MQKSLDERMQEFVWYHINGDGECNNVVLGQYADDHGLSFMERCDLAYFFSLTYCVESAVVILLQKSEMLSDLGKWTEKNKGKLIFQSDRKYVALGDRFMRCLEFYRESIDGHWGEITGGFSDGKTIDIDAAVSHVQRWFYFGRFAAFLFVETYSWLNGLLPLNGKIEWKKGDTATSGLLDLYGEETAADIFDKTGKLTIDTKTMDDWLESVKKNVRKSGGLDNATYIETSLCAYRKMYKGTRYNGFYLDRMLGEILKMKSAYPSISDELFNIRRRCFSTEYLGEVYGWNGIRTERKKRWQKTGKM